MKIKHILKAIASGIVWGLGQVFNKQYIKAAFFFVFFAVCVGIELGTSHYFVETNPYDTIKEGSDFGDNVASRFNTIYLSDAGNGDFSHSDYEEFYASHRADGFTMEEFITFIAQDLAKNNPTRYYLLNDSATNINLNEETVNALKSIVTNEDIYSYEGKTYVKSIRSLPNESGTNNDVNIFVNIANDEDYYTEDQWNVLAGSIETSKEGNLFVNSSRTKVYIEVTTLTRAAGANNKIDTSTTITYQNVADSSEVLTSNAELSSISTAFTYGTLYYHPDSSQLYVYYNPDIHGYQETEFSAYVKEYFSTNVYSNFSNYTNADYARFMLRVYFELHPETKAYFEENYDNFFSVKAGFFLKGIWSIITLGTATTENYYEMRLLYDALQPSSIGRFSPIVTTGDTSEYLLLRGLISTLLLAYFVFVWIWSIMDAYKTSKKHEETGEHVSDKIWFKAVYDNGFEYIVLLPALLVITFITIMPILYGFLVAFTSYSGFSSDSVGALIDWVGFRNFIEIFSFGQGDDVSMPFGETFWSVFAWTVVWSIFSTATVFFGGFFQAVIINSDRVPLKKFWRTVLILPWAVPAIISQMVFSIIFNETGILNHFLQEVGFYDLLIKWGMLGRTLSVDATFWERLTYLGQINIQWFTNPVNPTFVRAVIIVVNIWLGFPYYMALMSGIMTSIDKSLYEAADIDGANKRQKFRFITFPMVLFSTAPLLVMCFSGNFNNFGIIYFMTQGGANKTIASAYAGDTDILISWMYTLTVDHKIYNMASVFSILIFIIVGSIAAWNYSRTKAFKED